MKTTKVKTIGRITTKTFKTFFFTGSFLILFWIAYCMSILTADYLSYDPDEHEDAKIVLINC